MHTLDLEPDYVVAPSDRLPPPQGGGWKDNATITANLLRWAIQSKFPKGIEEIGKGSTKRAMARILNAMGRAAIKEAKSVDLELSQIELLFDIVKEWHVPALNAGWYETLFDHLEQTVARAKEVAEAQKNGAAKAEKAEAKA